VAKSNLFRLSQSIEVSSPLTSKEAPAVVNFVATSSDNEENA